MAISERQLRATEIAPLIVRQAFYDETMSSVKQQIELGRALQSEGLKVLTKLKNNEIKTDDYGKLFAQLTSNIEKGVKIEQDSREKYQELLLQCPK
jgi:hypothetical protein